MNTKLTHGEALALARGEDISEYRKDQAFKEKIRNESKQYIDTPVTKWPNIVMNWDVDSVSQRFSFDGVTIEEFSKYHPDGLCLGYVDLEEFDKKLCHFSRRDNSELWELGCSSKLAYLIVYLSEGNPISPPTAKPVENNEIIFIGGHHRYAIAKVINEKRIPIHVCPEHKDEITERVNIEWK